MFQQARFGTFGCPLSTPCTDNGTDSNGQLEQCKMTLAQTSHLLNAKVFASFIPVFDVSRMHITDACTENFHAVQMRKSNISVREYFRCAR